MRVRRDFPSTAPRLTARLLAAAIAIVAACATTKRDSVDVYSPLGEPGHATAQPAPTLTYLRTEFVKFGDRDEKIYGADVLLLRNDTTTAFQYLSQDHLSNALGRTKSWRHGAWVETTWFSGCGMGIQWTPIGPGEQRELRVESHAETSCYELKFGGEDFGATMPGSWSP